MHRHTDALSRILYSAVHRHAPRLSVCLSSPLLYKRLRLRLLLYKRLRLGLLLYKRLRLRLLLYYTIL